MVTHNTRRGWMPPEPRDAARHTAEASSHTVGTCLDLFDRGERSEPAAHVHASEPGRQRLQRWVGSKQPRVSGVATFVTDSEHAVPAEHQSLGMTGRSRRQSHQVITERHGV